MKTNHAEQPRPQVEASRSGITVRTAEDAVGAEQLLPLQALTQLCSAQVPGRVRQRNVYGSNLIVAFDRDSAIGFAAYKPGTGPVRVAHEFWIDEHTRVGLGAVVEAILATLERSVRSAGCSRLYIVLTQSTSVRRALEKLGYTSSLAGGELIWFDKSLAGD